MKKILVVDDDQEITTQVAHVLTPELKCMVDIAYNGKEALDKMKKYEPYDCIILALLIPKLNGIEVCRVMIREEKLKTIPVLLISVLPLSSETFKRSLKKFEEFRLVKEVLEKPFTDNDLLTKVKAIIGD